ncbi:uncharacterized protein LOC107434481 [Ziziphus jujuba]|uniref:Uncharacterized protein LOC107434481 n=2 Tax=Ziziphus jujuba TaxID=326968 RepID=A0A6P4ARU6_ZIZJJ|nr:uncharacterized protein LOC107434481 [Ziziphus jujuba]KAH7544792.1 hypothetical protein FEM48_Zijuj01G0023800 [Ziziphus jujuba var. spinosa]
MGSECNIPQKLHYDISMSKRTRKPLNTRDANRKYSPPEGDLNGGEEGGGRRESSLDGEENGHKSLKQLINGDGKAVVVIKSGGGDDRHEEISKGRSSLGQHFTEEEKNLQLITTQQKEGLQGRKLKKMVSRYAKVLSHLIKLKRDSSLKESQKKPVLRLTM